MKKTSCSSVKVLLAAVVGLLLAGQVVRADFTYSEPNKVPNVNSSLLEIDPQISRDGLELYFSSDLADINGESSSNIWVSSRSTTKAPWSKPAKLDAPVNTAGVEKSPSLSGAGLELYFSDGEDLLVSTRVSRGHSWGEPVRLAPPVNSESVDENPCISAGGLELYFVRNIPDDPRNSEILVTSRPTKKDAWGKPVILGPNVNSSSYEFAPFISSDSLSLFFTRGYQKAHVHVCRRATIEDPWGSAKFVWPVNSGSENDVWGGSPGKTEFHLSFSDEDSTLYFTQGTDFFATDYDIWQVEVNPIVDLNSDGIVDTLDIYELLEHWEATDSSLYDIAPLPFGDGIVDAEDLLVLAEHMIENEMPNDLIDR